jgi:RHS repeat-associated protein
VNFANGSATYSYDGNSLRVKRVAGSTTTVCLFSGAKVIAEYVGGASANSPATEYIYAGNTLIASIASGITTYHHADHVSIRLSTDYNGNLDPGSEQGHYPFGEIWYSGSAMSQWQFSTYERDSDSANHYALTRFYSSRVGRFLRPDVRSGALSDPQSLNLYTYVLNDPCNLADPFGLAPNCTLNINVSFSSGVPASFQKAFTTEYSKILQTAGINVNYTSNNPDYGVYVSVTASIPSPGNDSSVLGATVTQVVGELVFKANHSFVFTDRIQRDYAMYFGKSYLNAFTVGMALGAARTGVHETLHGLIDEADRPWDPGNIMGKALGAYHYLQPFRQSLNSAQKKALQDKCKTLRNSTVGANEFADDDALFMLLEDMFGGGGGGEKNEEDED